MVIKIKKNKKKYDFRRITNVFGPIFSLWFPFELDVIKIVVNLETPSPYTDLVLPFSSFCICLLSFS